MKRRLLALGLLVSSLLFVSCDNGTGSSNSGTDNGNGGTGNDGGRKDLFEVRTWRDTANGTYGIQLYNAGSIYPIPQFWINGKSADYVSASVQSIYMETENIPAGNLTYKIVWNGNTLTRTIDLPNNIYRLHIDSTQTEYRFSISGYSGNEKVLWRASYSGADSRTTRDTLSPNQVFSVSRANGIDIYCKVMHKDFKPLTQGATAETKNFAVYENIELWYFNRYFWFN